MVFDQDVERELEIAEKAQAEGNIGKARVCCRRAVGKAMDHIAQSTSIPQLPHALAYLDALAKDHTAPAEIRDAASRLRIRRNEGGEAAMSQQPLMDATGILLFLGSKINNEDK